MKFSIPVTLTELSIDITLQCGQSFRWRKSPDNSWKGVLASSIWILKQDSTNSHCQVVESDSFCTKLSVTARKKQYQSLIRDYFRLDVKLETLYSQWSKADATFSIISKDFAGIRILKQDPVENTFSFICSSNNNIQRITLLVDRLCTEFGTKITGNESDSFSFPTPEALSTPGTEEKLRKLGFGYRAKYIESSAKSIVSKGGEKWLRSLKETSYEECHSSLLELSGVGPKVADCICLMSMDHLHAIPVDTHVFQIASRDYLPHLRGAKSVTPKIYKEIGDHFRELFGSYAGWAHSVLFSADLKKFQGKSITNSGKTTKDSQDEPVKKKPKKKTQ